MISGNINGSYFPVYNYGELVIGSNPGAYYVSWTPGYVSTSFQFRAAMVGSTGSHYSSSFMMSSFPSGYFSGYSYVYAWNSMDSYIVNHAFYDNSSITTIKTNATRIEDAAFKECHSLWRVRADMCSYIGTAVFRECYSLYDVTLPNVEFIGDFAFYHCDQLSKISLPVCTYVSYNAFTYCSGLYSIDIPYCSFVGNYCFSGCSMLISVSLPVCTDLGGGVFDGCRYLSNVYIPLCGSVTAMAFYGCSSLRTIELPACSYIEATAFYNCISLSSLYLRSGGMCRLSGSNISSAFRNTPIASGSGKIYVPSSLVSFYKADSNWSYFSSKIYPIQ